MRKYDHILDGIDVEVIVMASPVGTRQLILEKGDCKPCAHSKSFEAGRWCKMFKEFHKNCKVYKD